MSLYTENGVQKKKKRKKQKKEETSECVRANVTEQKEKKRACLMYRVSQKE